MSEKRKEKVLVIEEVKIFQTYAALPPTLLQLSQDKFNNTTANIKSTTHSQDKRLTLAFFKSLYLHQRCLFCNKWDISK